MHCTTATSILVIETLTLTTYHKMFVCGGEKRVTAIIQYIYWRQRLYGNTIDSGFEVGMCSRKTCMSTPIGESVIKGLSNGLSTIIRI